MKKLISFILSIMLLSFPALSEENAENWYLENAWKQLKLLDLMLTDEMYVSMYTSDTFEDEREKLTALIPDAMPETYRMLETGVLGEAIRPVLLVQGMQAEIVEYLVRGIPSFLLTTANARSGAEWLSVTSVFKTNESVIIPDIEFVPGILVFDAQGDILPVVIVSEAGEGVANFSASFVMRDAFTSVLDVEALIAEIK